MRSPRRAVWAGGYRTTLAARMVHEMLGLASDPAQEPTRVILNAELVLRNSA
jgi:hypothetical protein